MASARGAGLGADMLQDILRRKLVEQAQLAQQKQFAERLAFDESKLRQDADQFGVTSRQVDERTGLDRDRLGETRRQFDANAPVRIANVGHLNASTASLNRAPEEAQKQRDFSAGESQKGRDFQGQQGNLNRSNALAIANVRHPDSGAAEATAAAKEQNEVEDALSLINDIRNDKALPTATGGFDGRGLGMLRDMDGYNRVSQHHETLINRMQLALAHKLKGQGAVSNFERDILKNAATSLNRTLGTPDYLKELDKVETAFRRLLTGPRVQAAPAATQPATTDYRKKYDY